MKKYKVSKVNKHEQYQEYIRRENVESVYTNNPVREENIDYEAWTEFISYYRYYIDAFAVDILGIK